MYSVVLIDDEQWVMEDLKTLADWESLGFRIAGEANDAETAKKVIAEQKPDLVISDIRIKTDVADVGNIVSVAANQIQWYRCTAELG